MYVQCKSVLETAKTLTKRKFPQTVARNCQNQCRTQHEIAGELKQKTQIDQFNNFLQLQQKMLKTLFCSHFLSFCVLNYHGVFKIFVDRREDFFLGGGGWIRDLIKVLPFTIRIVHLLRRRRWVGDFQLSESLMTEVGDGF